MPSDTNNNNETIIEITEILSLPLADDQTLGSFAALPPEMILHIMCFLSDKDLQTMRSLSHYFNNIVNDHFVNTIYGKGIRFLRWQQDEIKKIEPSIDHFEKLWKFSFRNLHYHFDKTYGFYIGLLLFAALSSAYCMYNESDILLFSIIFVAYLGVNRLIISGLSETYQIDLANNIQDLSRPASDADLNEIKEYFTSTFKQKKISPIFMTLLMDKLNANITEGVTTRGQLLSILREAFSELRLVSKELITFINKQGGSPIKFFTDELIQTKMNLKYINDSRKILSFWSSTQTTLSNNLPMDNDRRKIFKNKNS